MQISSRLTCSCALSGVAFQRRLAWAPCPKPDFSARFDCTSRTYKYYFPRGDLDLVKLNEGGQHLLGEHDYRNFCKMDVANGVVNYKRRITRVEASAIKIQNSSEPSPFDMCCLTIVGRAFLWHQIRLEGQFRSCFWRRKSSACCLLKTKWLVKIFIFRGTRE